MGDRSDIATVLTYEQLEAALADFEQELEALPIAIERIGATLILTQREGALTSGQRVRTEQLLRATRPLTPREACKLTQLMLQPPYQPNSETDCDEEARALYALLRKGYLWYRDGRLQPADWLPRMGPAPAYD